MARPLTTLITAQALLLSLLASLVLARPRPSLVFYENAPHLQPHGSAAGVPQVLYDYIPASKNDIAGSLDSSAEYAGGYHSYHNQGGAFSNAPPATRPPRYSRAFPAFETSEGSRNYFHERSYPQHDFSPENAGSSTRWNRRDPYVETSLPDDSPTFDTSPVLPSTSKAFEPHHGSRDFPVYEDGDLPYDRDLTPGSGN